MVVILLGATAWGQAGPNVGGGVASRGIHAFEWRVRVVEPDGTIDDLPMPNRNHGHAEFGVWACDWKLQTAASPAGKVSEQYIMECDSTAEAVGLKSALACDKKRPKNATVWSFGGPTVATSALTARCSEGLDAVTWAKSVEGPPASGLTKTGEGRGKALLGSWDCDWAQVQARVGPASEDRFELDCANPAGASGSAVVVSAWCDEDSKPSDEASWQFLVMGRPVWNGSAFAMARGMPYRVTASCAEGLHTGRPAAR
jgi:hypothetical protein